MGQLAGAATEAALRRLAAAEEGGDRVHPLYRQRVAQHVQRAQDPVAQPRPASVQTLTGVVEDMGIRVGAAECVEAAM